VGCGLVLATLVVVLMLFSCPPEAARRSQCVNNLKQIARAFHAYHDLHGSFPPAAITDARGRPLLSWRVLILPYLEQGELHARFRLDEPWDSPHNRLLLDEMPRDYVCPSDRPPPPGETAYLALVGESAAFAPGNRPRRIADFPDGLSQTIFVSESRRHVPWTKPDDVIVGPGDLHAALDGPHYFARSDLPIPGTNGSGCNICLGDGSVRFLKSTMEPEALRALVTRDGHEEVAADPD
jgi:hypothetical protein